MIFEFLGNSGAGKSAMLSLLVEKLQQDGLPALSVIQAIRYYTRRTPGGRMIGRLFPEPWQGRLLWQVFALWISRRCSVAFAVSHPKLTRRVITSQLRRPIPWQHRWLILSLFFQMVGWYHFIRSQATDREIVIFDEGFVHRAVHLFASELEVVDADAISQYLGLIPRSDLVILVCAPFETCLDRIQARGLQTRLRDRGPEQIERFMRNVEQVVTLAAGRLQDTGWCVIDVENDGDLNEGAIQLHERILNKIASLAEPAGASQDNRSSSVFTTP